MSEPVDWKARAEKAEAASAIMVKALRKIQSLRYQSYGLEGRFDDAMGLAMQALDDIEQNAIAKSIGLLP